MEHSDGGLEDHFPFFSWVICRMFHVNLPGCTVDGSEIRLKQPPWDAIMGFQLPTNLNWLHRTSAINSMMLA